MTRHQITHGSTLGLADTEAFIESLDASINSLPVAWRNLFDPHHELIVTRAPGRIDLMGGFGDYWALSSCNGRFTTRPTSPFSETMARCCELPACRLMILNQHVSSR